MPRAGLTATRIVEEAEQIADEIGLDRLSLAAVAERLGVRPPSLYKHIAGQDALRQLLETRATSELASAMRDAAVGRSGPEAIRAVAHAYREWAHAHPGRYSATLRAPSPGDLDAVAAATRAVQVVSDTLAGYGLTGDDATDATRALRAALHGFVSLEAAGGFGMPVNVDRSFERMVESLTSQLENWQPAQAV